MRDEAWPVAVSSVALDGVVWPVPLDDEADELDEVVGVLAPLVGVGEVVFPDALVSVD